MSRWPTIPPNTAWLRSTGSSNPEPFIDPAGCHQEAEMEEAMFKAILAEQQKPE